MSKRVLSFWDVEDDLFENFAVLPGYKFAFKLLILVRTDWIFTLGALYSYPLLRQSWRLQA